MRNKFLGSFVPKNDTISTLDEFVLAGIRRPGSTPYSIMQRNTAISSFMKGFRQSALGQVDARGCRTPTLLHSKYENMVSNFSSWAQEVLEHMVVGKGQRKSLHSSMYEQYKDDFVPNGKHKHALRTGANIAKLKRATIRRLRKEEALTALLSDLGYGWFGHDND